jgi:amino acid adenylation domain-containing protein
MTYESREPWLLSRPARVGAELPEPFRTWNDTGTGYPRDKTVSQLFEHMVEAYPHCIAVVFGDQELTYEELNTRANWMAHRLRRMGVAAETMVGCYMERSLELIISLLGILKAGGAYVPLDPAYPQDRLNLMIKDTDVRVLLSERFPAPPFLANCTLSPICVSEMLTPAYPSDCENPPPQGGPKSLAYVMFTSGSTGQPKGVMVENRAIIRLVRETNYCKFGSDEVSLLFGPVSFDASTFEIWGPLLNGGKLVVMAPGAAALSDLGRVLREQQVTTLFLTTAFFNLMVEQRVQDFRFLRQLYSGGEVVSTRHFRLAQQTLPKCSLNHVYGPTENTTFSTCYRVSEVGLTEKTIPIGKAISNTQVYVLDNQLRSVPPGQVGEIYVGGDGLARGYLNNPEATAEKFIPDPFTSLPGQRMYRTGDLGRLDAEGNIEFLGRIDNQVKILGHRIEPGEIESALMTHHNVKQVSVVAHTDEGGSKRLVAYYAMTSEPGPSSRELRDYLSNKLPPFMIPALFVVLPSLPLSSNGKVDRAALPPPVFGAGENAKTLVPSTEIEATLLEIWRRVLRIEHIGLDDNFFDLGGDSLLIVAVHSSLQKKLHREIPVTTLFEFTTIRTLVDYITGPECIMSSFVELQQQAQKQREAFVRAQLRRVSEGS